MKSLQPRKQPRQERSRRLVADVLDATAQTLAQDGYARLNTNAVARAAGISVGSLYQYFPNKEALVTQVVARHEARVHAAIAAAASDTAAGSSEDAVRRIVAAVVAAYRIDPALQAVLEAELPWLGIAQGRAGTVRAIVERLAALPADIAPANGARPPHFAAIAGEMIHALVHAALIPPSTIALSPEQVEEETVRAVLAYLAGHATAAAA